MTIEEAFTILKVPMSSDTYEIKKAFRKLAHIHHPDKGGDPQIFVKTNDAYKLLMKSHFHIDTDKKVYPRWEDGFIYYEPSDPGTYVGDSEDELYGI